MVEALWSGERPDGASYFVQDTNLGQAICNQVSEMGRCTRDTHDFYHSILEIVVLLL